MPRLSREVVITEKIDGTNAQVFITEDGDLFAGSRTRWITPADDNYGFAAWAEAHKEELLQLGPGQHFGEWWGQGIQRKYGLNEKRFSLFNTGRWAATAPAPAWHPLSINPDLLGSTKAPSCCHVVPVLATGLFDDIDFDYITHGVLATDGSIAAPGFMNPEGIIVFHTAANKGFKMTIHGDDQPKSKLV